MELVFIGKVSYRGKTPNDKDIYNITIPISLSEKAKQLYDSHKRCVIIIKELEG